MFTLRGGTQNSYKHLRELKAAVTIVLKQKEHDGSIYKENLYLVS